MITDEYERGIKDALAAIDALKNYVPVQGKRSRFDIHDLTRAFRAGISMAREDVAKLNEARALTGEPT